MPKLSEAMPLEVAFHTRTASIYSSMVSRFKQKMDKRGRVMRQGRIVPFTLSEFRLWLLEQLGGKPDGSARCAYCNCPVFADTLRVDHKIPVSRGGDLTLVNCCVSCDRDNRMKGSLTADEFKALQVALGDLLRNGSLHPAGFEDICKRLAGQVAIFRRFQANKPKKESGLLVEVPEQQKLLVEKLPRHF
jgi:5-methylcytosine-specific restriction endonuclease McrA